QVDAVGNNEWHATHVVGTLAGDGASSQGSGGTPAQWRGIAPGAGVLSYQFNPPSALMTKAKNGISLGMALANNPGGSLLEPFSGSPGACDCACVGTYPSLARDYDGLVRGGQGKRVAVVFSAGNDRPLPAVCDPTFGDYATMVPLGTAKNVLTVGG